MSLFYHIMRVLSSDHSQSILNITLLYTMESIPVIPGLFSDLSVDTQVSSQILCWKAEGRVTERLSIQVTKVRKLVSILPNMKHICAAHSGPRRFEMYFVMKLANMLLTEGCVTEGYTGHIQTN